MPTLTAKQARELARSFHEMSVTLGRYRFDNWDRLTQRERQLIESAEWSLLNASSDFTARSIEITVGDLGPALRDLSDATARLTHALSVVTNTGKMVALAAVAVRLAAAVMSGHLDAILAAVVAATAAAEGA